MQVLETKFSSTKNVQEFMSQGGLDLLANEIRQVSNNKEALHIIQFLCGMLNKCTDLEITRINEHGILDELFNLVKKNVESAHDKLFWRFQGMCTFLSGNDLVLEKGYFQWIIEQLRYVSATKEYCKGYADAANYFRYIVLIAGINEKCGLYMLESGISEKLIRAIDSKLAKKPSSYASFKTLTDTICNFLCSKPKEKIINKFMKLNLDKKLLDIHRAISFDDCHTHCHITEILLFLTEENIVTSPIFKLSIEYLKCKGVTRILDCDDRRNYPASTVMAAKSLYNILKTNPQHYDENRHLFTRVVLENILIGAKIYLQHFPDEYPNESYKNKLEDNDTRDWTNTLDVGEGDKIYLDLLKKIEELE